jgi:uncharacterized membrane protein
LADTFLLGVLMWFHIFSVVAWFGAVLFFVIIVETSLPKLSPQTNAELVLKVFPKFIRYAELFSGLTLIFGISLAFEISNGNLALFGLGSTWGLYVTIGASFGFATFLILFLLAAPSVNKLGKAIMQIQANPEKPPPREFQILQKRLEIGGPTALGLLSLALVFMVAAATV